MATGVTRRQRRPTDKADQTWRTIEEICERLDTGRAWLTQRLKQGQHETRQLPISGPIARVLPHYSPQCQRWLEQEVKKLRRYPPLGQQYTLSRAAVELGCTRMAIISDIKRYELPPISKRREPNNRLVDSISRRTFYKLRKIRQELLAPNDMATANELSGLTGWTPTTVRGRLRGLPSKPYIGGNGHVHDHYSISMAVNVLGIRPGRNIPPASDWRTANRMSLALNRAWCWIAPRLSNQRFMATRRLLLDDSNIPRWHYPPWVFQELEAMSKRSQ